MPLLFYDDDEDVYDDGDVLLSAKQQAYGENDRNSAPTENGSGLIGDLGFVGVPGVLEGHVLLLLLLLLFFSLPVIRESTVVSSLTNRYSLPYTLQCMKGSSSGRAMN